MSAENARLVRDADIRIAISTDSRSNGEFGTIRYGLEQGRRQAWKKETFSIADRLTSCSRYFIGDEANSTSETVIGKPEDLQGSLLSRRRGRLY